VTDGYVGALVLRYRAAGAHCVIVNGCLDPLSGPHADLMPQAELTVCRLRADPDEVARRFAGRQEPSDDLDNVLQGILDEAAAMDASTFADACVGTTGITAAQVAKLVRDGCRDWPGFTGSRLTARLTSSVDPRGGGDPLANRDTPGVDGNVLLIC
jgi:hypothetical protein